MQDKCKLRYDESRMVYDAICEEYERMHKALPESALLTIWDIAYLEDCKADYRRDIESRGVIETVSQGKQRFRRENKSISQLAKLCEVQARLKKGLGLTKASAAEPDELNEGEEDSFDAFD